MHVAEECVSFVAVLSFVVVVVVVNLLRALARCRCVVSFVRE